MISYTDIELATLNTHACLQASQAIKNIGIDSPEFTLMTECNVEFHACYAFMLLPFWSNIYERAGEMLVEL